jgi:hypothetical protein
MMVFIRCEDAPVLMNQDHSSRPNQAALLSGSRPGRLAAHARSRTRTILSAKPALSARLTTVLRRLQVMNLLSELISQYLPFFDRHRTYLPERPIASGSRLLGWGPSKRRDGRAPAERADRCSLPCEIRVEASQAGS